MKRFLSVLLFAVSVSLFGQEWQIAVSSQYTLADAQKISLSGVMPDGSKKVAVSAGTVFSLSKISGRIPKRSPLRAVVYTQIVAEKDETRHIGIGADWWFTCFINGGKVLSTEPGGNRYTDVSCYDHIGKVRFKKGVNHLVLFIRPNVYQWKFAFSILPELDMLPRNAVKRKRMLDQMFPPENPGLLRKELLHRVSVDQAAFACEFGSPVICGIRYGKAGEKERKLRWNTRSGKRLEEKIHRLVLTGLEPQTRYIYEIVVIDTNAGKLKKVSGGEFSTFPAEGVSHRFIAISDMQVEPDIKIKALNDMMKLPEGKNADFFVPLGDIGGHFDNFAEHYFENCFDILLRNKFFKPVVPVRGNHEYRGEDVMVYDRYFGRTYYAFRYGEVFYIVLDTGEGGVTSWIPGHRLLWTDTEELFAEQRKFLEQVVESPEFKNARYRIVLSHATPMRHQAPFYAESIRKLTQNIFFGENCKQIDLWLCAHVHHVSRFDPVTKTIYQANHPSILKRKIYREDLEKIKFSVISNDGPSKDCTDLLSVTAVEVSPEGLKVKTMTPGGKVIEEVLIRKGLPHKVYKSTLPFSSRGVEKEENAAGK